MFSVREEKFGPLGIIKLINEGTGEYISLLPERGGCLNELVLSKNGIKYSLLDGSESYEELIADEKANKFKGANMFPFSNRVNHGRYSYEGKNYQLEINFPSEDNAIHGLLLWRTFKVIDKSEEQNKATLLLQHKFKAEVPGYPFTCTVEVLYILSASGMQCRTKVLNDSDKAMPFGQGWHPYFKLGTPLNELLLKIPSDEIQETDERMIPTGKVIPSGQFFEPAQVKDHRFDTCYKITKTDEGISGTELIDSARNLHLLCWQESGADQYGYVHIYIPLDRKSIAIEPSTCAPDAFNNKKGLLILKPGQYKEFSYGVTLK